MIKERFLDKLLDGEKVELITLGNIGDVCMCKRIFKNQTSSEGDVPFFKIGTFGKEANAYISREIFEEYKNKYNYPKVGEVLISASGTIGRTVVFDGEEAYFQDSNIVWIKNDESNVLNRYLFHFYKVAKWHVPKGGTIERLYNDNLRKTLIPIPCPDNPEKSLKIQQEIVRILDTFTELTAELTAELATRKKQYNYYCAKLLSFKESEVEWKTLADIGKFSYGYAAKAKEVGDARFIRITDIDVSGKLIQTDAKFVDISKENEKYILKKNDLLMARTGATFGKTMIFDEDYTAIFAGFLIKLSFDKNIVNPRYYWHFAQSEIFWYQANKLVSGGGQPQFNANTLKKVKIPIPYPSDSKKSLAEQQRIVSILDKFEALTTSITEGLPREIELRKKQYEYYRDMLLSFPKDDVEV